MDQPCRVCFKNAWAYFHILIKDVSTYIPALKIHRRNTLPELQPGWNSGDLKLGVCLVCGSIKNWIPFSATDITEKMNKNNMEVI